MERSGENIFEAVIDIYTMFDNELIVNANPGIAKRLKKRKGKVVASSTPSKLVKNKVIY